MSTVEKNALDDAAHGAVTSPYNDEPPYPTEGQRSAGNYRKGHINVAGLDISIENPVGSHRRPEWPRLASHYGYIRRTEGADGDHIDCFVREGIAADYAGPVFVIDQYKEGTTEFDEHKVMLGWRTAEAARAAYLECYQPGWVCGPITGFNITGFKQWIRTGNTTKPVRKGGDPAAYLLARYHITVDDQTQGQEPVTRVLQAVADTLDHLAGCGAIINEALSSHYLMTIILYPGREIPSGCYAGAFADYEQDEATLYIAGGLPLEPGPLHVGDGEHNVSKDLHGILSHEIGHLVKPFVEAANHINIRSVFDLHPPEWWATQVSGYSKTDDHECFAECFSAYTNPAYTGGLPDEITDQFWAAGITPVLTKDAAAIAELFKGDLPGHEFHGNQWTQGPAALRDLFSRSLGISRSDMPQIPNSIKPLFLQQLQHHGVGVIRESVAARLLKPTQNNFNIDEIRQVRTAFREGKIRENPIVVSKDNYILDGHHRWSIYALKGKDIPVIRVSLPIHELLQVAAKFNEEHGIEARHATPVAKGDLPGHEFHGNQYTGGRGGGEKIDVTSHLARLKDLEMPAAMRDGLAGMYRQAAEVKPVYDSQMRDVATALGASEAPMLPSLKGVDRAVEKTHLDYNDDPTRMKDFVRGTVVIDNFDQAARAIGLVQQHMGEVIKPRNGLLNDAQVDPATGYRDIKLNVRVNGFTTEVQVNFKEMIDAKEGAGHPLYEKVRTIEGLAMREHRQLTDSEFATVSDLNARQRVIYDAAWEKVLARVRKAASSITTPLRPTDDMGKGLPLGTSHASQMRGVNDTGVPSTSANRVPAGNLSGSTLHTSAHSVPHPATLAKADWDPALHPHGEHGYFATTEGTPKPTQSSAKTAIGKVYDLMSSGHPFSLDELHNITGATKSGLSNAIKYLATKESKYGKLGIEKVGKGTYKLATGAGKPVGVGKPAGAGKPVAVGKPEPAGPKLTSAPVTITGDGSVSVEMANEIYLGSIDKALLKLQEGPGQEKDILDFKVAKATAMAEWQVTTKGGEALIKSQEVFGADKELVGNLKVGMTTKDAYAKWKESTALEKQGKAPWQQKTAEVMKPTAGIKTMKVEYVPSDKAKEGIPDSIVPAGYKGVAVSDFEAGSEGKFIVGMDKLRSSLMKSGTGITSNKIEVTAKLQAELKDSPNFQALKAAAGDTKDTSQEMSLESRLVGSWASTSGDSDEASVAVQLAARDVFSMKNEDLSFNALSSITSLGSESAVMTAAGRWIAGTNPNNGYGSTKVEVSNKVVAAGLQEYVAGVYRVTQADLAARGIKDVYITRGMNVGGSGNDAPEMVGVALQPISATSVDYSTSRGFGNSQFFMKVPASQVWSHYHTGPGCTNEHEVTLLAHTNMTAMRIGKSSAWSASDAADAAYAKLGPKGGAKVDIQI